MFKTFLTTTLVLALTAIANGLSAEEASKNPVELQVLDYQGVQELIASKKGKVVVMDAWATYCLPCVKEFPNLVALSKKYPKQVACISLSFDNEGLDPIEDVKPPVLGFLKKQGATFDNVISSEEADTLYEKFDLSAVPAVFVYDKNGKLSKRFAGEKFDYEDVEKHVSQLLEE